MTTSSRTRQHLRSGRALALLVLGTAGCGASTRTSSNPASDDRGYPGILRPAAALTPDFSVEQHVEARRDAQHGAFDAVVQKRGATLVVVGLGPMGVRAFVVRQEGNEARFEQTMGPPLPFPPRNVLLDVHRVFFKRLPLPAGDHEPAGIVRGAIDGEEITEVWEGGRLIERRFARPDRPNGRVRVIYGPGCDVARCAPTTVHLVNEWFGYELRIDNRNYRFFE